MPRIKGDQTFICFSPSTTGDILSVMSSHGGSPEGAGLVGKVCTCKQEVDRTFDLIQFNMWVNITIRGFMMMQSTTT